METQLERERIRPLQRDRGRLRWIAVLPGAILAGVLAALSLPWVLPYPQMPGRLLVPFAIASVFVWSGSRIAPKHRAETSVVLFLVWMSLVGGFIVLMLAAETWMGFVNYLGVLALAILVGPAVGDWDRIPSVETVMATAGALTGVLVVWMQVALRQRRAHGTDLKRS